MGIDLDRDAVLGTRDHHLLHFDLIAWLPLELAVDPDHSAVLGCRSPHTRGDVSGTLRPIRPHIVGRKRPVVGFKHT